MNSPPDSIQRRIVPDASLPRASMASASDPTTTTATPAEKRARFGPPSPASSSSAIAVGTSHEAAVIQSIERGEYAADDLDDTRSLTDSIRQHIVDGGLRYHAYHAGKYLFPNDETEQCREDLKHNLTLYLCDGESFFAPMHSLFEEGAEVLDLGECGEVTQGDE